MDKGCHRFQCNSVNRCGQKFSWSLFPDSSILVSPYCSSPMITIRFIARPLWSRDTATDRTPDCSCARRKLVRSPRVTVRPLRRPSTMWSQSSYPPLALIYRRSPQYTINRLIHSRILGCSEFFSP